MEFAAVRFHSYKENLPPFTLKQYPSIPKKPIIRRRFYRKPLLDITNFFENSVRFGSIQDGFVGSVDSVCSPSNSRKRKAGDEICSGTAKSLRMGFR
ncbi:unnamed protein product [Citrullus colocynthis]|uniref:Uncharacterized protein n=1 Tax=Citrullus colocynthis TaxID=252529 RepID=A0ABP0XSP0_9ROSI